MEKWRIKKLKSYYRPPKKKIWQGRKTRLDNQYWHQIVEFIDLTKHSIQSGIEENAYGLLGYACDEGVRRNLGRPGAEKGPNAIRRSLAKIAWHRNTNSIIDFGNVICTKGRMEKSQEIIGTVVAEMLSKNITPILLGGGHDIAFGHFLGIYEHSIRTNQSIGIINFDAHFDLRPLISKPNSGTPFYQISKILQENGKEFHYLVAGIQKQSNPSELFEIAHELGVKMIHHDEMEMENLQNLEITFLDFISDCDIIYLTVDLDGFSSAFAPGVSAPNPLGFSPNLVFKLLESILKSNKVIAVDVAELNPQFDVDGRTSVLAARLIDLIVDR